MTKEQEAKINDEYTELMSQYEDINERHRTNAERLSRRAAYLKVNIECLEDDLITNGWTEPFQQSLNVKPYDRRRPNADIYTSLVTQYTRIIKQLDGMLPKGETVAKDDELMDFLGGGKS